MDHGVGEQSFDGPVGESFRLSFRHVRELEVVDVGGRNMMDRRNPEQREGLLDALRLGVDDARLELDPDLDPDRRRDRSSDLPVRAYRMGKITIRPRPRLLVRGRESGARTAFQNPI